MSAQKKQCLVCNNMFEVCPTCENLGLYGWRSVVCCYEHWNYHLPIIQYERKIINKEQAKQELQNAINTYGMIDFNDDVKNIVAEILAEDVIKVSSKTKAKKKTI